MISKIRVENFRSIEASEISFGKFTVLTGGNNSGKSSFLYALLCLKNLISNPNQSLDNFFNFREVVNLGGFNEVVFDKNNDKSVVIEAAFKDDELECSYKIELNSKTSSLYLKSDFDLPIEFKLDVSFPYPLNNSVQRSFWKEEARRNVTISWDGVGTQMLYKDGFIFAISISKALNLPLKEVNKIDNVPLRRTFTRPNFGSVPMQQDAVTEEEIATKLALNSDLEENISHYLEKILNKKFKVNKPLGTTIFRLETFDKNTRFNNDLVNDGLGTNQLIFILFKALQKDKSFICIDEPEIHLHPSIISKLVDALVEIAEEENKQFLISTHNEHLMTCLLTSVANKKLKPEDLKVYYLTKPKKKTEVELQEVNEDGQIAGGLKNFYEAELENLAILFNIAEK